MQVTVCESSVQRQHKENPYANIAKVRQLENGSEGRTRARHRQSRHRRSPAEPFAKFRYVQDLTDRRENN